MSDLFSISGHAPAAVERQGLVLPNQWKGFWVQVTGGARIVDDEGRYREMRGAGVPQDQIESAIRIRNCSIDLEAEPPEEIPPTPVGEAIRAAEQHVRRISHQVVRVLGADGLAVGTGFFLSPTSIVSCAHVHDEAGRAPSISWHRPEGLVHLQPRQARLPDCPKLYGHDLVLYEVDEQAGVESLPWSSTDAPTGGNPDPDLQRGTMLGVIGVPLRLPGVQPLLERTLFKVGRLHVTGGRAAQPGEEPMVAHDAPTAPGMSGSPVFALGSGALVGVHTGASARNLAIRGHMVRRLAG